MKRILLLKGYVLFTFCLFCTSVYAQQPTFQWAKHLKSDGQIGSGILDMELDKDKNILIVGYFYDSIDVDPGPDTLQFYAVGQGDSYIAKLDSNGTLLWANHIGNVYNDRINAVDIDTSGNIYTGGSFSGTIDLDPSSNVLNFTNNSSVNGDSFIQKFDSNGNLIWAKVFGSSNGDDQVDEIEVTPYGDIIASGVYQGTADFDPNSGVFNLTFVGWIDAYVLRLDTNGDFVWAKSFGGQNGELVRTLEIDESENIYFGGVFENSGDFDPGTGVFTLTSQGGFDTYFVKIDANGDFVWAKSYDADQCGTIALDNLGNAYLTGGFENTCNFDVGGTNTSLTANSIFDDGFVLKLDSIGNFTWVKHLDGNTGNDLFFAATTDNENNLYVGGLFWQNATFDNIFTVNSNGSGDAIVSKIDTSGTIEWVQTFGGLTNVNVRNMKVDNNNALYSQGDFSGTADFDPGVGVANLTVPGNGFNSYIQKLAPPLDNDAGVTAIQAPNCSGSFAIPTTIQNFGANNIDTLQVEWSINGVLQPTYFFNDTIEVDSITMISLDTFDFQFPQNYTVKVWTSQPNNQTDAQTFNDTTTITFTPNPVYQINQSFTVCQGQMISVGNMTYNSTGIYTDTLSTIVGCDSIIITNLTVNSLSFDTVNAMICSNQIYNFGGSQYNLSGSYNDTLTNVNGCDSIVTLNLTVNPLSLSTLNVAICSNQTYNFNGNILNSTGSYQDTLSNTNGCDSIVTLNLMVNPPTFETLDIAICSNQTYNFNGNILNTTGSYQDTLSNVNGCDSVVTLNLTINPTSTTTIDTAICSGETFVAAGITHVAASTYIYFLQNWQGCDSVLTLNLTVNDLPIPIVQQVNDSTLEVNTATTYQWYLDGNLLPNETNQTIVPMVSGLYSVEVTNADGCTAQSTDFQFFIINTDIINIENNTFKIYPNPTTEQIFIENRNNMKIQNIGLFDLNGKLYKTYQNTEILDITTVPNGFYILKIKTGQKVLSYKIWIQ